MQAGSLKWNIKELLGERKNFSQCISFSLFYFNKSSSVTFIAFMWVQRSEVDVHSAHITTQYIGI